MAKKQADSTTKNQTDNINEAPKQGEGSLQDQVASEVDSIFGAGEKPAQAAAGAKSQAQSAQMDLNAKPSAAKAPAGQDLSEEIANLQEKLQTAEEKYLRSEADKDNIRRRSERDVTTARKFGVEKFAKELLPVIDSLEKALETAGDTNDSAKAMHEGIELTLKMFESALAKFSVTTVNPLGEAFDPTYHEAMSMQEDAEAAPGTVLMVFQKGYLLHDRLIRSAKVVVSKAVTPKVEQ